MPPYHCLFKAIFMLLLTVNDLKTINIPLRASGEKSIAFTVASPSTLIDYTPKKR